MRLWSKISKKNQLNTRVITNNKQAVAKVHERGKTVQILRKSKWNHLGHFIHINFIEGWKIIVWLEKKQKKYITYSLYLTFEEDNSFPETGKFLKLNLHYGCVIMYITLHIIILNHTRNKNVPIVVLSGTSSTTDSSAFLARKQQEDNTDTLLHVQHNSLLRITLADHLQK